MKILIIEDNPIKFNKINDFIQEQSDFFDISHMQSYTSAVNHLAKNFFDLIIIDMSLPTYDRIGLEDGGKTRTFGGKEIASQMKKKCITTPFTVITQYDNFTLGSQFIKIGDLKDELSRKYSKQFLGIIHFDATNNSWKDELNEVIRRLANV